MKFFSNFTEYMGRLMMKMSQVPGLGFMQNYVQSARAIQYRFGDHVEDYEIYLGAGQDVLNEVGIGGRGGQGRTSAKGSEAQQVENVYDDYEYDENDSSRANFLVDDYPVSDDRHSYYDDDYRAQ